MYTVTREPFSLEYFNKDGSPQDWVMILETVLHLYYVPGSSCLWLI